MVNSIQLVSSMGIGGVLPNKGSCVGILIIVVDTVGFSEGSSSPQCCP